MVDYQKLRARMKEVGITQKELAAQMKIAVPTVSQKLSGIRPIKLDEVDAIASALSIKDNQISEYFFAHPVA